MSTWVAVTPLTAAALGPSTPGEVTPADPGPVVGPLTLVPVPDAMGFCPVGVSDPDVPEPAVPPSPGGPSSPLATEGSPRTEERTWTVEPHALHVAASKAAATTSVRR